MNTRFLKWLLTVTIFFLWIFVAANVAAKRPPPVPTEDPCLTSTSTLPAFVFWRIYSFKPENNASNRDGKQSAKYIIFMM